MFKSIVTILFLAATASAFFMNQNVSRSIQLKPLNYARAITSTIKEVQTPKGAIELPKSLQKITTEEIRDKPDQRIFDICWYLQKTHNVSPQQCFKSIADMKVSEREQLKADMVLKGMDQFKIDIDQAMAERKKELSNNTASTPKGQADNRLKDVLKENVGDLFKKKGGNKLEETIKKIMERKMDTKIEDMVDKRIESKDVQKAEAKINDEYIVKDGSFTAAEISEKLATVAPKLEEKGIAEMKKVEVKENVEIVETFKKDAESEIKEEIKIEVQEQEMLILENMKEELGADKDTKIEDVPEQVAEKADLDSEVDREVERRLAEFEAAQVTKTFDEQVEERFKKRLQEKLDEKAKKMAEFEKTTANF